MKLLTCFVLSVTLGIISSHCCAQTDSTGIEGKVLTEFFAPAEAATIRLLRHPDSVLVASTISDKNGFFEFKRLKPGSYFISINKMGYKRIYTVKYHVIAKNNVKATDIQLVPLTHQLAEVQITARKEYIEVRPDKTILNVDKSIVAAGNNMLDMLKNAPGVRVSGDEVFFKGGQRALIAVNGKPVLLTGDQLADLLKSYQSSMVSRVELIDNPSSKYDAAGGGVINIVLKKDKDMGLRLNISESAAIGQDYKLNTTTGINYRNKKINLFGTYNFSRSRIRRTWDIYRTINTPGRVEGYDVNYISVTTLNSHSFNAGTDITVSPKQNVGMLINGFINPTGIDKKNNTLLRTDGRLDSSIITNSFINRDISNVNYNANYRGMFGFYNTHTLSADVDYSHYIRGSIEDLRNDFNNADGSTYNNPLLLQINSPSYIDIYSFKADYTRLFGKTGNIDLGFKISKVDAVNMIDFDRVTNNGNISVDSLTNRFDYHERIDAAYINYVKRLSKFSLVAGLRAEATRADREAYNPQKTSDTSYFNIFPSIQLNYDWNDEHQFTFSYNRRILRPNYQDLNPFVAYIDKYAYSTGNPYLRPEYVSSFQLSDIFLYKYKAALTLNVAKDFTVPIFQQDDNTGVYTTISDNIGTRYQYMAEVRAPVEITNWWKINTYMQATYERYLYKRSGAQNKSAYDLILQLNQQFTVTSKISAEINGYYETPTYYGIKYYREQYYFSAGVSHTLGSNGSLKLAVSDIFNTQTYRYNTRYLNLNLTGVEKPGTRFVTATFTYRFGNTSLKGARKRAGGNVAEQTRLKDGDN